MSNSACERLQVSMARVSVSSAEAVIPSNPASRASTETVFLQVASAVRLSMMCCGCDGRCAVDCAVAEDGFGEETELADCWTMAMMSDISGQIAAVVLCVRDMRQCVCECVFSCAPL